MKITTGSEATHPLLVDLIARLPQETDEPWDAGAAVAVFWQSVAEAGTPLRQSLGDGRVRLTYLWRERAETGHDAVRVEDGRGTLPLAYLAGTDVWFAEEDVPADYVDLYCFALSIDGRTIDEDVHEPWPASFSDEFNTTPVCEEDAAYARNIASAQAPLPRRASRGSIRVQGVPCTRLELPDARSGHPRPGLFPVWVYRPAEPSAGGRAPLPVVVLMNGQLLDSSDAAAILDDAMDAGRVRPALVVAAGRQPRASGWADGHAVYEPRDLLFSPETMREHTAWGWRHGHGPHDLGPFLAEELLPTLHDAYEIEPVVHLVAWGEGAQAALATACSAPAQVASVTLLAPRPLHARPEGAVGAATSSDILEELAGSAGCRVAISQPTARTGAYRWHDDLAERLCAARGAASVARVPLSDPNIAAAGAALVQALDWALA